jgi:hypothetical protein
LPLPLHKKNANPISVFLYEFCDVAKVTNQPQEDLAKSGYKPDFKIQNFNHHFIFLAAYRYNHLVILFLFFLLFEFLMIKCPNFTFIYNFAILAKLITKEGAAPNFLHWKRPNCTFYLLLMFLTKWNSWPCSLEPSGLSPQLKYASQIYPFFKSHFDQNGVCDS